MDITHLGHSCLLLEVGDARLAIDPGGFSDVGAIEGVDAVLITHQHADHVDVDGFGALLERNPGAQVHAEPATARLLRERGHDVHDTVAGEAVEIGSVTVTPVGAQHAEIHPYLDRIDNLGLVVRAPGEPTLFHPGDALDAEPGEVDHLAVPVNAPWCAVKETIAFVRRIAPRQGIIPIHDALLKPPARAMYLKHIGDFGLDGGVTVTDLAGAGTQRL